jgi:CheY-like chemotaxis protein
MHHRELEAEQRCVAIDPSQMLPIRTAVIAMSLARGPFHSHLAFCMGRGPVEGRERQRIRRVLIVDDDRDMSSLLDGALRAEGHVTELAHDAAMALRVASVFRPHVALLDIGLPGMDGFDLARALRERPELDKCRFVAVTGHELPSGRQYESPIFNAHFVKPVNLRKLLSVVLELDYYEVTGLRNFEP